MGKPGSSVLTEFITQKGNQEINMKQKLETAWEIETTASLYPRRDLGEPRKKTTQ